MKKRVFKVLGVLFILFSLCAGGFYYAYQSGWIEEQLSQVIIPFEWFGQSEVQPVGHLQVKDVDRRDIKDYAQAIRPLIDQVKADYRKRPNLKELEMTDDARENLSDILDKIYGVDYTYISQVDIAGLLLTADGWQALMNLAVVEDSPTYTNTLVAFSLNHDDVIENVSLYLEDEQRFAYSALPQDFDLSIIDQALHESSQVFSDLSIESSEDPFIVDNQQFLGNRALSKVQFINSYVRVYTTYSIGTNEGVKEYTHIYHLDKD